ncbi:MAG: hypothetical protein IJS00_07140 [Paludibacteraceae bacterium]|nr:hypothetical protein [Paludibacteraceae bacterium]
MSKNIQYSIIYAVIRPEISERLSLGIVSVKDDKVKIRYSKKKLEVLKGLYSPKEYKVISRIVKQDLKDIQSASTLMYLTRYSNNLIAFSPIRNIDTSESKIDDKWLFQNYVYKALSV